MTKKNLGLTAAALSSFLAASAAAQDQQADDCYQPSNPALESGRFHTGPEFLFTPVVGLEFSGPYLAAVAFGEQLCATDEPDDPVSLCVGGTYNPVRMTFTNEEGFPQLMVASPIERFENESLGMLYGNVRFHFLPGDPSVDLDLGVAASYTRRRTQEVIDVHQQGPSIEEVIATTVPFIGVEACEDGHCVNVRWGIDTEESGTLTQVLYGIRFE